MPSTVALMSSIGVSMLASSARIQASRSQSRKSPGGGPPALLTRMSGSGHAASAAARPSGVVMSHATQRTGAPAVRADLVGRALARPPRCARRSSRRSPHRRAPARSRGPAPCSRRRPARVCRRCRDPCVSAPRRCGSAVRRDDARAPDDRADRDQEHAATHEEHLAARWPWSSMRPNHTGRCMRAEVEPRVDEAVDAPRRALRRRVAHDEVARRARSRRARSRSARTAAAATATERRPIATSASTAAASSSPAAATRS